MDDRYGGFDLDAFGMNSYKHSTASTVQAQQRYNNGMAPNGDNYDPTARLMNMNMSSYNSTGGSTQLPMGGSTHRTVLPAPMGDPGGSVAGLQLQHQQQLRAMGLQVGGSGLLRNEHHRQMMVTNNTGHLPQRPVAKVSNNSMTSAAASTPSQHYHVENQPSGNGATASTTNASPSREKWLEEMSLEVSALSLEPMSGSDILSRVETRSQQVITRYLPCVDFLVQCQQELRKGLAAATTKRLVHHMFRDAMTPRQFYNTYIAVLPERFYRKNRRIMSNEDITAAFNELQTLCGKARDAERQGCEVVKNTFLGGMKDGESWGLRKWLSKHGGALHICNDSEVILNACQKLDRSKDTTRRLGDRLRPLAKKALQRLTHDVPSSYQEHSTAHPYLPFFHRLEAALKGMSNFDPEDDDVICIDDDDEVEELKAQAPPPREKKRKHDRSSKPNVKRKAGGDSDNDSVILVVDPPPMKQARAAGRRAGGTSNDESEYMGDLLTTFDDDAANADLFGGGEPDFDSIPLGGGKKDVLSLAASLDRLAVMFESDQASFVRPSNVVASAFWDEPRMFASALRLFSDTLRNPDSDEFLERIDEQAKPHYTHIVRHPLCFRDIVCALIEENDDMTRNPQSNNGILPAQGLDSWNMWRGSELLQAIDLVFLNSLGYGKAIDEGRSSDRSKTNRIRKLFWAGIKDLIDSHVMDADSRRKCTPTRRGETSGFVVFKDR
eukprot:Nitzschia sp. Nitz4//scaffold10_size219509//32082//34250//NITZ4_001403-RA/size219509-processed-gene-0.116-mRNA-1//-1//CDS//3329532845//6943//frame0